VKDPGRAGLLRELAHNRKSKDISRIKHQLHINDDKQQNPRAGAGRERLFCNTFKEMWQWVRTRFQAFHNHRVLPSRTKEKEQTAGRRSSLRSGHMRPWKACRLREQVAAVEICPRCPSVPQRLCAWGLCPVAP